jgi:hypothetical protein
MNRDIRIWSDLTREWEAGTIGRAGRFWSAGLARSRSHRLGGLCCQYSMRLRGNKLPLRRLSWCAVVEHVRPTRPPATRHSRAVFLPIAPIGRSVAGPPAVPPDDHRASIGALGHPQWSRDDAAPSGGHPARAQWRSKLRLVKPHQSLVTAGVRAIEAFSAAGPVNVLFAGSVSRLL